MVAKSYIYMMMGSSAKCRTPFLEAHRDLNLEEKNSDQISHLLSQIPSIYQSIFDRVPLNYHNKKFHFDCTLRNHAYNYLYIIHFHIILLYFYTIVCAPVFDSMTIICALTLNEVD